MMWQIRWTMMMLRIVPWILKKNCKIDSILMTDSYTRTTMKVLELRTQQMGIHFTSRMLLPSDHHNSLASSIKELKAIIVKNQESKNHFFLVKGKLTHKGHNIFHNRKLNRIGRLNNTGDSHKPTIKGIVTKTRLSFDILTSATTVTGVTNADVQLSVTDTSHTTDESAAD